MIIDIRGALDISGSTVQAIGLVKVHVYRVGVRRNESARLIYSPLESCVIRGTRGQPRPTRPTDGWYYTPRFSTLVAVALPAFLREAFLFVEYLGFELFPSLFQICVAPVVRKEDVPFDLLQWDLVFSIKILKDAAT